MIKNYLLIAYRNLIRNKTFSLLNILGLAIGITAAITIGAFVIGELKVDTFQREAASTYFLFWNQELPEKGSRNVGLTGRQDGELLKGKLAAITDVTNVRTIRPTIQVGEQKFSSDVLIAESQFFQFFDFELIEGNPLTALSDPASVVLTQELATKYFGAADPIGQTLRLTGDYEVPLKVTGVIKDYPDSHMKISAIVPWEVKTTDGQSISEWYKLSLYTYIKTGAPVDTKILEEQIAGVYAAADYDLVKDHPKVMPLADMYLHAGNFDFMEGYRFGSLSTIKTLGVIGLLTLLMACINFINASTAQSMKRAKEVGVRKSMGASTKQLRWQFLFEAVIIVTLAWIAGVTLADLGRPVFTALTGKVIYISIWQEQSGIILLASVFIFTALFSGLYPSLVMSSWSPVESLKGKLLKGRDSRTFRELLIAFQFVVTVCLIAGSLLIYQQNQFMLNKDLGFDKEQVIVMGVSQNSAIFKQQAAFLQELETIPTVVAASSGMDALGNGYTNNSYYAVPEGGTVNENGVMATYFTIDEKFSQVYDIDVVQGRFLSKKFASDSTGVVINETLAKSLGYDDPIDHTIKIWGDDSQPLRIVGVLKDFHFQSLHKEVTPALCILNRMNGWNIAVRLTGNDYPATLNTISEKWENMESEAPFNYAFLDDKFSRFYNDEQRLLSAINFFSMLSILVACIGLYGLTSFMVQQRTKEIGVRKVLGASISGILVLLNRRLLVILGLSVVVATPITFMAISSWLSSFAYKASISWWSFGAAGLLVASVIVLTVSVISLNAARRNPVRVLRYE
jgi:putative ABC transport system permease protein